jgi:ABC-type nickel/cobalt efflux system permease component RcnA
VIIAVPGFAVRGMVVMAVAALAVSRFTGTALFLIRVVITSIDVAVVVMVMIVVRVMTLRMAVVHVVIAVVSGPVMTGRGVVRLWRPVIRDPDAQRQRRQHEAQQDGSGRHVRRVLTGVPHARTCHDDDRKRDQRQQNGQAQEQR